MSLENASEIAVSGPGASSTDATAHLLRVDQKVGGSGVEYLPVKVIVYTEENLAARKSAVRLSP
jgi:hypothetical protein